MSKILVRDYPKHAGKWIYEGFSKGWETLGYNVERWTSLTGRNVENQIVMMASGDLNIRGGDVGPLIEYLAKMNKIYIFVSPTKFPDPWGKHPNFVDPVSGNPNLREALKTLDNTVLWTFCNVEAAPQYWEEWGKVHYVPLAFDDVSYVRSYNPQMAYDVCYIGGWADNGFNTKKDIMKEYLGAFKDSGLKCGFFINKNLSHQQECEILTNSKVCLNIHDEYQHKLRLDTNERTWKSLGLNGVLVSDYVGPVVPDYVHQCQTPEEMVAKVKELIAKPDLVQAERNVADVLKNHTYFERCKQLEKL